MQKQTFLKFFLPILIVASVFSGPVYNVLVFLNVWVLESHWSIYYDPLVFANLMAFSFLIFTIILILTLRWIDKLLNEQFIILGILLIGFCCIFASLLWAWEIIVLVFLITSAATGFLVPMLFKHISNTVRNKYENSRYSLVLLLGALFWVLFSYLVFNLMGVHWRILYFITGLFNISSSVAFILI